MQAKREGGREGGREGRRKDGRKEGRKGGRKEIKNIQTCESGMPEPSRSIIIWHHQKLIHQAINKQALFDKYCSAWQF